MVLPFAETRNPYRTLHAARSLNLFCKIGSLARIYLRAMRFILFASIAAAFLFVSAGCTKEDQPDGDQAAGITFRTDSGYTWRNDTVSLSDTLRIGVTVTKGSNNLRSFFVDVSYNGGPRIRQDSAHVDGNPFSFEKTVITRDQAGTETWRFSVDEYNGNNTLRALTLTVQ